MGKNGTEVLKKGTVVPQNGTVVQKHGAVVQNSVPFLFCCSMTNLWKTRISGTTMFRCFV